MLLNCLVISAIDEVMTVKTSPLNAYQSIDQDMENVDMKWNRKGIQTRFMLHTFNNLLFCVYSIRELADDRLTSSIVAPVRKPVCGTVCKSLAQSNLKYLTPTEKKRKFYSVNGKVFHFIATMNYIFVVCQFGKLFAMNNIIMLSSLIYDLDNMCVVFVYFMFIIVNFILSFNTGSRSWTIYYRDNSQY